jgi:competence protein ComEC
LRRLGVRRIDLAIVSHAHPDHLGGFAYLSRHFPIGELWWSGAGADEPGQAELNERVRAGGGKVQLAAQLPSRSERGGLILEVLHPRPDTHDLTYYPAMHLNDNSIVLRIEHGQRSLLLTGDIERDAEALLATSLGPSDVLKSPHHGSRSSSTAALLDSVRPGLVVISCGENNRFGLPDEEVLAAYASRGMQTWRTDLDGMVSLTSDGRGWRIETFRGAVATFP